MAYRNYIDLCKTCRQVLFSEHPIPPMLRLHQHQYPPNVEFDYHSNSFSSACLVLSGAMTFQERGFPEFKCSAGTLALVPVGSVYRWRIDDETDTFHCLHNSFSSYEHGELSILFGMWQRHLGSVALGTERADSFMRDMESLQRRKALDVFYSIATLELLASAVESLGNRKGRNASDECAPITKCVYFIERNLEREISVQKLAREANVSPSRLFQLFQANFGVSPLQYAAGRKTEEAKRLLTSSSLSIGEIAERLGFSTTNYFIRFFKKHAGCTPNEMRRRERIRILGQV